MCLLSSPKRAGSCSGRKRLRWIVCDVFPMITSSPLVGACATKISHFSRDAIVFPDRIAPSQQEIFVVDSATDLICLRESGNESSTAATPARPRPTAPPLRPPHASTQPAPHPGCPASTSPHPDRPSPPPAPASTTGLDAAKSI